MSENFAENRFQEFQDLIDELEELKENPGKYLSEHIADLKLKIDLEREQIIQDLYDQSNKMIKQLDAIEAECNKVIEKKNLNSKDISAVVVDVDIDNLRSLSDEWSNSISHSDSDSNDITAIEKKIQSELQKNRALCQEMKRAIFNQKSCSFVANVSSDFLDPITHFGHLNFVAPGTLFQSSILATREQAFELVELCGFESGTKFNLKYRATRDGFEGRKFHAQCNDVGPTLTIVKAKGSDFIFGGYTEASWTGEGESKRDDKAFLFSLVNREQTPLRMKVLRQSHAIMCYRGEGAIFGEFDLVIGKGNEPPQLGHNTYRGGGVGGGGGVSKPSLPGRSQLGRSFRHSSYERDSFRSNAFLAGTEKFYPTQVETYQVDKIVKLKK